MKTARVAFYSSAWRGGSGWFVFALASAIAESGTAITLFAPRSEPPDREVRESKTLRRVVLPRGAGGKGTTLYRMLRSGWRVLISFVAIVEARFRHSTYLVTHLDWLQMNFFRLALIRLLGARLIYIVHDAKPHAWAFPRQLRWLEIAMLKRSYQLPSHLVTLTHACKRELVDDFGIDERKVTVIPHGAFETPFLPDLSGDTILLLFGMLRRNKHILESIKAMPLLPADCRARLIIAGAIHAEDAEYWSLCNAAIPEDTTRIQTEIGFIPEERVQHLLSICDAVLLPYAQFNSQSGVAVLAGLAGRSLIATDVGGIGELIAGGVPITRIAQPVTPETIATALAAYCGRDAAERRAEALETKVLLEDMLSWRKIGQSYSSLLGQLCGSVPPIP